MVVFGGKGDDILTGSASNDTLKGAGGNDLLIGLQGGDTLKEGGELTENNSFLYRGRSEIPGVGVAAANFKLG